EVPDPALVVELDRSAAVGALVDESDAQSLRQERGLAETRDERRRVVHGLFEDLGVREEGDRRSRFAALAHLLYRAMRNAACELLPIHLAVVPRDLGHEPLRKRVHDRRPDSVEPAGDLVSVAA